MCAFHKKLLYFHVFLSDLIKIDKICIVTVVLHYHELNFIGVGCKSQQSESQILKVDVYKYNTLLRKAY